MSLAAADSQTSKQTNTLGKGKGMQRLFTFHFFRLMRANLALTPTQVVPLVNRELTKYKQGCHIYPTRKAMMNEPIVTV
jgi:hypothetical protein